MGKTNLDVTKIQKLLALYLRSHSSTADSKSHLDEDLLNSFVEGRLSRPESSLILKHLTNCSFCLRLTAELAKFEYEFAGEKIPAATTSADKPEKISDVLNGLLSKIFGASDRAVFAHQEDAKEKAKKED